MYLNEKEEKMYKGEVGESVRKAMEILVALGDIYNAERLIRVESAHIAGLSYKTHGDAGLKYVEDLVAIGASVQIPTTVNVIGVDRSRWRELGLPRYWAEKQLRILSAYEKMGCLGSCSCTPYYHGILPRLWEHVACAESSAVVFLNSVIGARDNREGGPSALASALTGLTPLYGYHLDQNRVGTHFFEVNAELKSISDYGALGAYVGRMIGEHIPVFDGISKNAPIEGLVALGAGLASSGAVAMFHAVGITPEAHTLEKAFGDAKPKERIQIGNEEMRTAYEQLTSAASSKVEYVAIGCPHCSIRQIKQIADLLRGKQVSKGVRLWIHTSVPIKAFCEKTGLTQTIEKAGGVVTADMCTVLGPIEALGLETAATDSAKLAFYAPGTNKLKVWYGSVEKCIEASIKGKWD